MTIGVEERLTARVIACGTVSSVAVGAVAVDGNASAGSRHLLGSADALTEQVRLTLPANCVGVDAWVEVGQGSHGFSALLVADPGTDYLAAVDFNAMGGSSVPVLAGERQPLQPPAGVYISTLYVLAIPLVGATSTSVAGRIHIRARCEA